ncbi:MAG: DUF4918 family protein [Flavobacteriales bacterium]|nr:DUF4918 family protein [Flavobacteriales bacterium]
MPRIIGAGHFFLASFGMEQWSDVLSAYYRSLTKPIIPRWYECMNPYERPDTMRIVEAFLSKYYADEHPRMLLFGINPGRFGSGITGISFTDPIRLKEVLHIDHSFDLRPELSSEFIYDVIAAFGGTAKFFSNHFISAVYPLGFLHEGKNINYYELDQWRAYMLDPIADEINKHMLWNVRRDKCLCIGQGENFKVLNALNKQYAWFDEVIPLPHPRWVLQYRRKRKEEFIDQYLRALS